VDDEKALNDEDVRAIAAADEEIDRGEFLDFDAFAAEMRTKYCGQDGRDKSRPYGSTPG
jgi:hypothetical protein